MRFAFIIVALLAAFLMFGCIGQPSTGASNYADYGAYSGKVNTTGIVGPYELKDAYSRHVFSIWTSNNTQQVNTTTFTINATETCAITGAMGGTAGAVAIKFNDTALSNASGTLTLVLNSPERNFTKDNLTIKYQNVSGENITVTLNGILLGKINQSVNSTVFVLNGSNLLFGTNTFVFTNTNISTNITNVTLQYLNASFACTSVSAKDGTNGVLFETADVLGQFNITIANITMNNSTTFELDVYGGDIGVVTNTNSTYIGLNSTLGFCDPLGYSYPLAWNTTGWTNITDLNSTYYAALGYVKICTVRKQAGSVSNFGVIIDYVVLNGNYTYNFTGGSVGNVTFQTSLDNRNWFTEATMLNVGPATRIQTNNTALYARFNVTALGLADPGQDGLYIQYYAVSN